MQVERKYVVRHWGMFHIWICYFRVYSSCALLHMSLQSNETIPTLKNILQMHPGVSISHVEQTVCSLNDCTHCAQCVLQVYAHCTQLQFLNNPNNDSQVKTARRCTPLQTYWLNAPHTMIALTTSVCSRVSVPCTSPNFI